MAETRLVLYSADQFDHKPLHYTPLLNNIARNLSINISMFHFHRTAIKC